MNGMTLPAQNYTNMSVKKVRMLNTLSAAHYTNLSVKKVGMLNDITCSKLDKCVGGQGWNADIQSDLAQYINHDNTDVDMQTFH